MGRISRSLPAAFLLVTALGVATPVAAQGQGRGRGGERAAEPAVADTLPSAVKAQIREFYSSRPPVDVEALPPGIRMNLARGKPLPRGIAKKVAPEELRSRLPIPEGYELVEVGLDVLLVQAATNVVQDIVRDIVR